MNGHFYLPLAIEHVAQRSIEISRNTTNSASDPAATKAQASDTLPVLRNRFEMEESVFVCILSISSGLTPKISQPISFAKKINDLWLTLSCGTAITAGLKSLSIDIVFSKALLKLSKVAEVRKPKPAAIIFPHSIGLLDKQVAINSLTQLLWLSKSQYELDFPQIH
jgi:hypothetical protein